MATTSVRTRGGVPFSIRSRVVVVAGGAIENARLLLTSTAQCPTGLGNRFDNVGRFFMDHPRPDLSPHLSIPQWEGVSSARIVVDLIRSRRGLAPIAKHLPSATRHAIAMARYVALRNLNRSGVQDQGSGRWTGMVARSFMLQLQPEQAANPGNRVTLGQRAGRTGATR